MQWVAIIQSLATNMIMEENRGKLYRLLALESTVPTWPWPTKQQKVARTCGEGGGEGGYTALASGNRTSLFGKVTVWKSHCLESHCSEKSLFGNSQIGNGMALTGHRTN